MREQYEMEQLVEVDKQDKEVQLAQQTDHIQTLEQQLQQMSQHQEQEQSAAQILDELVNKGVVTRNEDGTIQVNGSANVIGNAHEFNI